MSREYEEILLYKVEIDDLVDAKLYQGLEDHNISAHADEWIPILLKANQDARDVGKPNVAQDAGWDWRVKAKVTKGQLSYDHYAIECEGKTVGLLLLKLDGCESRIEPGKPVVYVDFICISPENRPVIQSPPTYKGIGGVLFHAAIEVSFEAGMEGRIGLHSLPQADEWYENKIGMQAFEKDPDKENLVYFELTTEQAKKLREERTKE